MGQCRYVSSLESGRMPGCFARFTGQGVPARQGQLNRSGTKETGEMEHGGFSEQ
jgi:hypothetical protein